MFYRVELTAVRWHSKHSKVLSHDIQRGDMCSVVVDNDYRLCSHVLISESSSQFMYECLEAFLVESLRQHEVRAILDLRANSANDRT